jgi:hypothetical protein
MACKAIQYSDEMHCAPCGLRWDVNDPEPPACRLDAPRTAPPEEIEDDGFVTVVPDLRSGHGPAHSHPAER